MLWADVTWRSCVRAEEEERWFVGRRVCIRTAGLTCARRVHLETEHIGTEAQSRSASEVAMRRTRALVTALDDQNELVTASSFVRRSHLEKDLRPCLGRESFQLHLQARDSASPGRMDLELLP